MILKWLTGYAKDIVKDVTNIKRSGVKCINAEYTPIVETATGNKVCDAYTVTFSGNILQMLKARRIMQTIKHED